MSIIKNEMKNLKDDLGKGMKKVKYAIKDSTEEIKDDVQGVMMSMEMKKDDMVEEYKQKKFAKDLKNQMEKEIKH